ncbi:hypothetical protein IH992_16650, partial [Candidatus Poribacteria bacterium]|nr:hypothetical protein [Candidatus Poribacteria bacterium]
LLPVCPYVVDYDFETITIGAMWIGTFILFIIFFLTSTMVSKITIQQLRGDSFFSMRDSAGFVKKNWKAVFGTFIGLIVIFILFALTPIAVGLLGKIPVVGRVIVMLASILMPLAFFLGLLMMYLLVVLSVSTFFVPAVVAAADADTFESVYQHFSIIWNQPWRIIVYEALLFGMKAICVPIWSIFCAIGFALATLPLRYLLPTDMQIIMGQANQWLGGWIAKLAELPYVDKFKIFQVFDTVADPANGPIMLKITAVFMTLSLLFIAGLVIAYLLSMASAGNTLIYTILRRRVDGENLLEVKEEDEEISLSDATKEEPQADLPKDQSDSTEENSDKDANE